MRVCRPAPHATCSNDMARASRLQKHHGTLQLGELHLRQQPIALPTQIDQLCRQGLRRTLLAYRLERRFKARVCRGQSLNPAATASECRITIRHQPGDVNWHTIHAKQPTAIGGLKLEVAEGYQHQQYDQQNQTCPGLHGQDDSARSISRVWQGRGAARGRGTVIELTAVAGPTSRPPSAASLVDL